MYLSKSSHGGGVCTFTLWIWRRDALWEVLVRGVPYWGNPVFIFPKQELCTYSIYGSKRWIAYSRWRMLFCPKWRRLRISGAYSQESEQTAVAVAVPQVFDKEGTETEGKALNLPFNLHSCFQGQGYKRLKWVFSTGRLGFPLERCSVIQNRAGIEPLLLSTERSLLMWFGHLIRMPPCHLPRYITFLAGRKHWCRPRTRWSDYYFTWAWKYAK